MEKAWAKGATRWLQVRRLFWLMLFGLAHYFLIWRGDILFSYAICGFLVLGFITMSARVQFVIGLLGYTCGALLWGGLMAMIMVKVAPERVSGIVLNDVGPVVNPAGLARIAAYSQDPKPAPTWQAAAEKVKAAQADAFSEFTDKDWMAFARRTWREQDDGSVRADYDPAITQSLGEAKAGPLTKFAMWRLFGSLRSVPLLILRGETSDILSKITARRMARRHPASELVTIPNRGHAPILDEPTSVSAISTFLQLLEPQ